MKHYLYLLFTLSFFGIGAMAGERPNIILILTDDLGYGDISCYGSEDIPTPNIDRLAEQGVRATRFYNSSSTCTPSRATYLTGRYPHEIGLSRALMGKGGMKSEFVTIAEALKTAGYATSLVGKWHLGYGGDETPNAQGFDYFYGHLGGKIDYFTHTDTAQKGKHDFYENDTEIFPEGYATELFTAKAIEVIKRDQDKPFFLFIPYNAPHYGVKGSLQAPDAYIERFPNLKNMRQIYAAMVACVDDGVGEIMQVLNELELEDNTIVIFTSDHGADKRHGGDNGELSQGKFSLYEGGLRSPMIVRWPTHLKPDTVVETPLFSADWFPSLMAAADLSPSHEVAKELDGTNIWSILEGNPPEAERTLFFSGSRKKDGLVAMHGRWKLMGEELFDVVADPAEKKDLASQHPEIVQSLKAAIAAQEY